MCQVCFQLRGVDGDVVAVAFLYAALGTLSERDMIRLMAIALKDFAILSNTVDVSNVPERDWEHGATEAYREFMQTKTHIDNNRRRDVSQ